MACLKCGVEGITEALILCIKCKLNAEHYYCLDELPKTLDLNVQWVCHECRPGISFCQPQTNLITKDEPTLRPLNYSLMVIKQKMQTGHARSSQKEVEIIELEDSVNIAPVGLMNESDCTQSSGSLDFFSDTDDEYVDKAENSKMGKHRECDVAWTHAVKIQEPKHGLVCKYCSRPMTGRGSITRLKEHLAGGYDLKTIKACPSVPLEVKKSMKKILEEKEKAKAALMAKARTKGEEIKDFAGRRKVRKDPAWEYAYRVNGKAYSMICKFCSQTISGGGITRFKRHLSEKCIKAPPEVQEAMKKVLIKKDIVRAKMDAKVDKIKREIREKRDEDNHWNGLSLTCNISKSL